MMMDYDQEDEKNDNCLLLPSKCNLDSEQGWMDTFHIGKISAAIFSLGILYSLGFLTITPSSSSITICTPEELGTPLIEPMRISLRSDYEKAFRCFSVEQSFHMCSGNLKTILRVVPLIASAGNNLVVKNDYSQDGDLVNLYHNQLLRTRIAYNKFEGNYIISQEELYRSGLNVSQHRSLRKLVDTTSFISIKHISYLDSLYGPATKEFVSKKLQESLEGYVLTKAPLTLYEMDEDLKEGQETVTTLPCTGESCFRQYSEVIMLPMKRDFQGTGECFQPKDDGNGESSNPTSNYFGMNSSTLGLAPETAETLLSYIPVLGNYYNKFPTGRCILKIERLEGFPFSYSGSMQKGPCRLPNVLVSLFICH